MKPENALKKAQIELCYHINEHVCTPIIIIIITVVYTELTLTFINLGCVQFPFPILQAYCIVSTSY